MSSVHKHLLLSVASIRVEVLVCDIKVKIALVENNQRIMYVFFILNENICRKEHTCRTHCLQVRPSGNLS